MKIFTLYFEFYGKKMKTDILAVDIDKAKRKLENKIIYHKVESKQVPDKLMNIATTIKDLVDSIFKSV